MFRLTSATSQRDRSYQFHRMKCSKSEQNLNVHQVQSGECLSIKSTGFTCWLPNLNQRKAKCTACLCCTDWTRNTKATPCLGMTESCSLISKTQSPTRSFVSHGGFGLTLPLLRCCVLCGHGTFLGNRKATSSGSVWEPFLAAYSLEKKSHLFQLSLM